MTNNRVDDSMKRLGEDAFSEEDRRIDWERKKRGKRQSEREAGEDVAPDDVPLIGDIVPRSLKADGKKNRREKRRHLIYDEDRNTVVVKRKRRRQTDPIRSIKDEWDEWDGEY